MISGSIFLQILGLRSSFKLLAYICNHRRCIFSYISYIFLCIFVSFPTKLVSYIIIILKNQNNKLKFWVQSDFHHNNTYKSVRWCIVKHKLIPYIFENRKLNSLQRGLKYNIRLHHWIRTTPSKIPFLNQTHWKWLSLMLSTMPTSLFIQKKPCNIKFKRGRLIEV